MMQKLERDFRSHSELSKVSLRLEKNRDWRAGEAVNDVKVGHHGSAQSTNKTAFGF